MKITVLKNSIFSIETESKINKMHLNWFYKLIISIFATNGAFKINFPGRSEWLSALGVNDITFAFDLITFDDLIVALDFD